MGEGGDGDGRVGPQLERLWGQSAHIRGIARLEAQAPHGSADERGFARRLYPRGRAKGHRSIPQARFRPRPPYRRDADWKADDCRFVARAVADNRRYATTLSGTVRGRESRA